MSANLVKSKSNRKPDKKVTPDSAYLWLKTIENEIYFSGFPKKHVRVAISQKVPVRISWYVPHFVGFWIEINLQYEFWLETILYLYVICGQSK